MALLIVFTPGSYLPFAIKVSEPLVGDMGTVALVLTGADTPLSPLAHHSPIKRKAHTLYVYLLLGNWHYLAERRASMFPLDNLTKVSTDSFPEVYFDFGRNWWS